MGYTMSFSSLAVTFLATTAAAIPANMATPKSNYTLVPLTESAPPTTFLTLADLNKHELKITKEAPSGYPYPHWNATSLAKHRHNTSTLTKRALCLHDPSYVAGGAVWLKYSTDFCKMAFPKEGEADELTERWTVAIADLSDYPGWSKLAFGIEQDPYDENTPGPKVTQEECNEGFRKIVKHAVEQWDCQGYSGHNPGDGQGSFAGGSTQDEEMNPKYYMWVIRPDWPWETEPGSSKH